MTVPEEFMAFKEANRKGMNDPMYRALIRDPNFINIQSRIYAQQKKENSGIE